MVASTRQLVQFAHRWECHNPDVHEVPVLLARYDEGGRTQIKVRDRIYTVTGTVRTTCPVCGRHHDGPPKAP